MAADHSNDVFHHIRDSIQFELPGFLGGPTAPLPGFDLFGYHFQLTKFMVLQVVAGLLTLVIFRGLAGHIRSGRPARGRFWNFWEMLAVAIRDEVARPAIGTGHHHDDISPGDGHEDSHAYGSDLQHEGFHPDAAIHSDNHSHGHSHGIEDTGSHPADKYLPYVWSCF
ncbi:MAG: atpB 1, partial [Planctomycetaceae bacterium]|nr:atpB 1 [Planctomycetaceae bacterium]